jgi:hypothetical protein
MKFIYAHIWDLFFNRFLLLLPLLLLRMALLLFLLLGLLSDALVEAKNLFVCGVKPQATPLPPWRT